MKFHCNREHTMLDYRNGEHTMLDHRTDHRNRVHPIGTMPAHVDGWSIVGGVVLPVLCGLTAFVGAIVLVGGLSS